MSCSRSYLGGLAAMAAILLGGAATGFSASAPLTIQIVRTNANVMVKWTGGPTGNPTYQLLCRSNVDEDWAKLGQPTTALSTTVAANKAACFFAVTTDLIPPSTPTSLRVSTNTNPTQLLVTWSPSSDNSGGTGLKEYNIFRNNGTSNLLVGQVSATNTTLLDSGLTPDTTYTYTVSAADKVANQSAQSGSVSGKTPKGQCTFSIFPTSASVGAPVASGSVSVTAGIGCTWTAGSSASWITITSGSSGSGNGTVYYSVAANTATTTRTGTLTIAGNSFTVTQSGASPCSYTISPTTASVAATANSGYVSVTAGTGCSWTAASGASWITITSGSSGSGNGYVYYSVAANTTTTARTGTLTIAGRSFSLTQAGTSTCSYTISPASTSVGALATSGYVSVTAGAGCVWTASSSASWLTITSGTSGNGSGTVYYSVGANTSTSTRSGTLSIAGQTFTVTQAGVIADTAPTATLTSPGNGATLSGTVTFTGNASDDLGILRVEFWCDGSVLLGTATVPPYSVSYNTAAAANGTHTFVCKAFDTTGHSTTSSAVSASVNNTAVAATGQFAWSKYSTGPLTSDIFNPFSIQTDVNGNIFVAGAFSGTIDLGGTRLTSSGDFDAYVAKYSASGALVWAKRFGGTAGDYAYSLDVDKNGDILVSGCFSGTVDFGGGALVSAGSGDIFVLKLSNAGTHVWSKRFGGTGSDAAYGVAADKDGNVVLMGWFGSGFAAGREVDFGGGLLSSVGGYDIFVAKLSGTGSHLWSKRYGGAGIDRPKSMAVDANGDVLLAAQFENQADYGGGSLSSAGYEDVVIAKYSGATGGHIWSKRFGGALSDSVAAVTVDGTGNVSFTGMFGSTIDFNGVPITTVGLGDIYLAKFNSSGGHVWSKTFVSGQTGRDGVSSLAVDSQGNVIMTGGILSALSFGGAALTNPFGSGTVDTFVAKFSATGAHLWSNRYGGYNDDWAATATTDRSDNVFVMGQFYGSMQFGTGEQSNTGGYDGFIAKFAP